MAVIGIDVGGTFTDGVLIDRDRGVAETAKVPSTPDDQSAGLVACAERLLVLSGLEPAAIDRLVHGMTVATNAMLEGRVARTGLVTTRGFADVLALRRGTRPSLYDLSRRWPDPLVPAELRLEVDERCGPDGVEVPLDEGSVRDAGRRLAEAGVEAVAVCLLWSFRDPGHERRVRELLAEHLPPGVPIVLSSDVRPEFREYERTSTTVAGAALGPVMSRYLDRLVERCAAAGLVEPRIMGSSGGWLSVAEAAAAAERTLLSGPAGGAAGAARIAAEAGFPDALCLDMGGTSCDVALVAGGEPGRRTQVEVAGHPVHLPSVDVHTISSGGGSIAWVGPGRELRVGPRSAGARPGPACYGLGGTDATVTDADVVLGHLPDGLVLGEAVTIAAGLAREALGRLGARLGGLGAEEAARGVRRLVQAQMERALRVVSIERGVDPRDLALVAFGGAGPMHACELAEALGMRIVLVPAAGGVLSALGLALADARREWAASTLGAETSAVAAALVELEATARHAMPDLTRLDRVAAVRYRGQSHEIDVPMASPDADPRSGFEERHETAYGYRDEDAEVEVVAVRLAAVAEQPGAGLPSMAGAPEGRVVGPAVVPLRGATVVVTEGWAGEADARGTLVLRR